MQNQSKLTTLKSLNLSNNALTKLPDGLFDLPNLEHLDLSGNQLESIDVNQVLRLSSLSTLDLRGNRDLTQVETFHSLTNVQVLTGDTSGVRHVK